MGWVGVVGLSIALGLLAGCQENEAAPKLVPYTGPLMETQNVTMLLSDSARLQVRLVAPLEQDFENSDRLYPKGVKVLFFDKPGKVVINTIDAQWAKYENSKQLWILRRDVRVANVPQQQKLNTEELFYDRAKQQIFTDRKMFVRVETPIEVLTGYGLTALQDFSRYSIYRPLGTFTLEEARQQGK